MTPLVKTRWVVVATMLTFKIFTAHVLADEGPMSRPDEKSLSPMDADFAVALHEYLSGDASNAFTRLDNAIENSAPTDRWYLYLPLYRASFDAVKRSLVPLDHSASGRQMISEMASKREQSAATLVKLCVLTPTRVHPDSETIRAYLDALVTKYPQSPWSVWAQWQRAEMDVQELQTRMLATPYPLGCYHVADAAISFKIMRALEADAQKGRAAGGIMHRWMMFRLCKAIELSLMDVEERLATCRKEYGAAEAEMLMLKRLETSCPTWIKQECRILDIERGVHPEDPTDVLCAFFESMRDDFGSLPSSIPRKRKDFDRIYRRADKTEP